MCPCLSPHLDLPNSSLPSSLDSGPPSTHPCPMPTSIKRGRARSPAAHRAPQHLGLISITLCPNITFFFPRPRTPNRSSRGLVGLPPRERAHEPVPRLTTPAHLRQHSAASAPRAAPPGSAARHQAPPYGARSRARHSRALRPGPATQRPPGLKRTARLPEATGGGGGGAAGVAAASAGAATLLP